MPGHVKCLLSILLFFHLLSATGTAQPYYFRHYEVEDGLSSNTVSAVLQDYHGFMWFGTKDGLNRFDGYRFKPFRFSLTDSLNLGSNFIKSLFQSSDSILWVGTDKGLFRYDEFKENFHFISSYRPHGDVRDITEDEDGNLWYICGLRVFRKKNNQTPEYIPLPDHIAAIAVCVSPENEIWVSSRNGHLFRYSPKTGQLEQETNGNHRDGKGWEAEVIMFTHQDQLLVGTANKGLMAYDVKKKSFRCVISRNSANVPVYVRDMIRYKENEYWLATESGIYQYNPATETIGSIVKEKGNPYSLSDNAVYGLCKDKEGGVWAATYFGGINYLSENNAFFEKFFPNENPGSLQGFAVREICMDSTGTIWVGTEDGGLHEWNKENHTFINYSPVSKNAPLSHYNIHALIATRKSLWIGSFDGLDIMDLGTRKIQKISTGNGGPDSLKQRLIYTSLLTSNGDIFFGTTSALYRFRQKNKTFQRLEWIPNGTMVTCLYEDNQRNIWAGTIREGIFIHNLNTGKTGRLYHPPGNGTSIPSSRVNSVMQSSDGYMWLCSENGLSRYDTKNGKMKTFSTAEGLPSGITYKAVEDAQGDIWVSTTRGLVCLDPKTGHIRVFRKANGLLTNQFNYSSGFRDPAGYIYFGSVKGLIRFHPGKFTKETYKPPVLITGFQVNNNELSIIDSNPGLSQSIITTKEIELPHYAATFSIDFAAQSFKAPSSTRYAYQMNGLDKDWIYLPVNRKVYFTELPAGTYTFRVKAGNQYNEWGQPAELKIVILPPLWKSPGAYTLYTLLVLALILFIIRNYHRATRRRNERRMERFQNERKKELYNAKIEFFTNVAHEIKTPLTLIKLPLEKSISQVNGNILLKENLLLMQKNTNRLIDLTNQLLDFRKTENNVFSLSFVKTDICALVEEIFLQFRPAAEEKGMKAQLHLPRFHFQAYIDPEAVKKILSNLLSNAIKYGDTETELRILPFGSEDEHFSIRVFSNGKSIPPAIKEKIFEPFYRADTTKTEGTGIGLALSRSLADLHHGKLELETERNGNAFIVTLPVHQEQEFNLHQSAPQTEPVLSEKENHPHDAGKNSILLVEDNREILDFIAGELQQEYTIYKASNGAEALEKIKELSPSLIISDVMMPVMDGFELCRALKENFDFCHIPIILLTAKNTLQSKIEGLELGADAYIEKPFSQKHLNAQIVSLLNNRNKIKEYFAASPLINIKTVAHSKKDETFLLSITDIINRNIGNPEMHVEFLASAMNMSRQTFHRKIKGLTDLTPNELITITKLKKAAELLASGDYKIYEVAETLGYSVAANFSRDFMKQFGLSPTEYMGSIRQPMP